jgi:hypothetical protein
VRKRSQHTLVRELLFKGIEDLQGSIHANDSKCSAALITHGLLFAGVVTVTANAAKIYPHAHGALPILALVFAGLAACAFVVSIAFLLLAVMPYQPSALAQGIGDEHLPPRLFFPPLSQLSPGGGDPVRRQLDAAGRLDEEAVTLELVAESVKLADIRRHEARFARVGYRALMVEVALVVVFLGLVGATALNTGGG